MEEGEQYCKRLRNDFMLMRIMRDAGLSNTRDSSIEALRKNEESGEVENLDSPKWAGSAPDSEYLESTHSPSDHQNQTALHEVNSNGGTCATESTGVKENCSDSSVDDTSRTVEQSQPSNELHPKEMDTSAQSHEHSSDSDSLHTPQGSIDDPESCKNQTESPGLRHPWDDAEQVQLEEVNLECTEVEVGTSKHIHVTETGNEGRTLGAICGMVSDVPVDTVPSLSAEVAPMASVPSPCTEVTPIVPNPIAEVTHVATVPSPGATVTPMVTAPILIAEVAPMAPAPSPSTMITIEADTEQSLNTLSEEVVKISDDDEDSQRPSSPYILIQHEGMQKRVLDTTTFESQGLMYAHEEKAQGIKKRESGFPPAESATDALDDDSVAVEEQKREGTEVLQLERSVKEEPGEL